MPTLTAIESPRRGSKRRRLLIDDELWRETSSEVVARLELAEGDCVELTRLDDALAETEPACAKERAIRLLTYRERSSADLVKRLLDDGYPESVAQGVVGSLADLGLVDDARFAASLAHSRSSRGIGRTRALRDLAAAGIDEETALAAVDEALPPEDEAASARVLAGKAAARRGATVDKVASALLRRGYRAGLAFATAREAMGELGRRHDADAVADIPDEDPFHRLPE